VGLSSGRERRRPYRRVVETLACPSHSWTLREVGAAVQGVGGRRGPQGVRAEAPNVNPGGIGMFAHDAVVDDPWGQWPLGVAPPGSFAASKSGPSASSRWSAAPR
jgi:hypothetical protein